MQISLFQAFALIYCVSRIFSADIFDEVTPAIEEKGLDCECLGGGRIVHEANKKKIEIFGYSQVSIHLLKCVSGLRKFTQIIGKAYWLMLRFTHTHSHTCISAHAL